MSPWRSHCRALVEGPTVESACWGPHCREPGPTVESACWQPHCRVRLMTVPTCRPTALKLGSPLIIQGWNVNLVFFQNSFLTGPMTTHSGAKIMVPSELWAFESAIQCDFLHRVDSQVDLASCVIEHMGFAPLEYQTQFKSYWYQPPPPTAIWLQYSLHDYLIWHSSHYWWQKYTQTSNIIHRDAPIDRTPTMIVRYWQKKIAWSENPKSASKKADHLASSDFSNRNLPVAAWVLPSKTLCYTARVSRGQRNYGEGCRLTLSIA